MKKLTSEKCKSDNTGITLIALVITIIVLLILAGVTINSITGNESVMEKAQEATEKTDDSNELEAIKLSVINSMTNGNYDMKIEASELNNELQRDRLTSNYSIIKDYGNGSFIIQSSLDTQKKYRIMRDGEVYLYNVTSTLKGCRRK